MTPRSASRWIALGAGIALVGAAGAAWAEVSADERRALGLRLVTEGRCDAALPELDAARRAQPDDALLALRAGQCRLRSQDYVGARSDLEQAEKIAPGTPEIALALAKAQYHSGDPFAAQTTLESVASLEGDAEAQLYLGLLAGQRADPRGAVAHFERALALDASRVEPVASFELGRALVALGRRGAARTAFQGVNERYAGTEWATQAGREINQLDQRNGLEAWLTLTAGIERDTNVVLRGNDVPLPADISDDDDTRAAWAANVGAEFLKTNTFTAGAMASYRGSTHFGLEDFDSHYPSFTLWLQTSLVDQLSARLRYDFGYAWFDADPFASTNGWRVSFLYDGEAGFTELFGAAHIDEYFFESDDVASPPGPFGLNERRARNRDGWGASAGLSHTVPLPDFPLADTSLRAGYRFAHYDSEGEEYSHDTHEATLAVAAGLPFELGLDASGTFAYRPYRNATTFPDPSDAALVPYPLSGQRRRERAWQVSTSLSRPIGELVSVSARWRYIDNDSNADVFDYDQHVLGVYVTLGLGGVL